MKYTYATPTNYKTFDAVFSDCAQGLDPDEVHYYWDLWEQKYQPLGAEFNEFVDMVCESVI